MNLPAGLNNIPNFLNQLKNKPESHWLKRGEKRVLNLFHQMSQRVPAYKDFLRKNKINPKKIKTMADFASVPVISKDSYLTKYPLEKLCWDGELKSKSWTIAETSGSTGEPFYFPREHAQDLQYAAMAEMYLRINFKIHERSTLYIDAFPMGPWIGGVFTFEAIRLIARRVNFPLSIITTGINKAEIIKAVKKFGHSFDQIIIGCYGPFLKDALDEGREEGVRWREYNLGFIFSAEGFSENFRDFVIRQAGLKKPLLMTLNHYGTVDLGTMAHETPLSILMRRLAVAKPNLFPMLFRGSNKSPTLCQYLPELFYFEDVNGDLLCSAYSGLPLVRYNLKDRGGIWNLKNLAENFKQSGVDIFAEAKKAGIEESIWNLPLVFVYERSDFSVSLYAFQIYPETIRKALQERVLEKQLTSKFTMAVKFDKFNNQYLEINIELTRGAVETRKLTSRLTQSLIKWLLHDSLEYAKTYQEAPERVRPRLVFWPYEHAAFFRPGIKQRWTQKN